MCAKTEALKQFFSAINRNDMQAITKDFDPQIVRIEPEGFPTAGTYRGIAEVQEHVTKGRGLKGHASPRSSWRMEIKLSCTSMLGSA